MLVEVAGKVQRLKREGEAALTGSRDPGRLRASTVRKQEPADAQHEEHADAQTGSGPTHAEPRTGASGLAIRLGRRSHGVGNRHQVVSGMTWRLDQESAPPRGGVGFRPAQLVGHAHDRDSQG